MPDMLPRPGLLLLHGRQSFVLPSQRLPRHPEREILTCAFHRLRLSHQQPLSVGLLSLRLVERPFNAFLIPLLMLMLLLQPSTFALVPLLLALTLQSQRIDIFIALMSLSISFHLLRLHYSRIRPLVQRSETFFRL